MHVIITYQHNFFQRVCVSYLLFEAAWTLLEAVPIYKNDKNWAEKIVKCEKVSG